MTKTIGIVGMGVSGFAVLLALSHLAQSERENYTILCFDDQTHFGRGIPFQEDVDIALINSPIDDISFDYRDMGDFVSWMDEKGLDTMHPYVSRSLYGCYMKERGQALLEQMQARVVTQRVDRLIYLTESQQWQVVVGDEVFPQVFDEIHLACGELPTIDPYELEEAPGYIANPYPIQTLKQFNWNQEAVTVIGTGLAAVDALKWLLSQQGTQVSAFSRSNAFPTVRILEGESPKWTVMTDTVLKDLVAESRFSFEQFEDLFNGELAAHGFEDWGKTRQELVLPGFDGLHVAKSHPNQLYFLQKLVSRVADWFTDLWPLMSDSDRQHYQERYEKDIVNLRNPMPEDSAEVLMTAAREGRLMLLEQVEDVKAKDDGFIVLHSNNQEWPVNYVVNATGYHLTSLNQDKATSLLRQILDEGLAQVDSQGGLSILVETSQVISPRYGTMPTLFAHGELINGVVYQNNSTIKIQKMAERAVGASCDY